MLVTISRDAARVLRVSTSLAYQYSAIAAAIKGGQLSDGRWRFSLTPDDAIHLRAWCEIQADAFVAPIAAVAAEFAGRCRHHDAALIANRGRRATGARPRCWRGIATHTPGNRMSASSSSSGGGAYGGGFVREGGRVLEAFHGANLTRLRNSRVGAYREPPPAPGMSEHWPWPAVTRLGCLHRINVELG